MRLSMLQFALAVFAAVLSHAAAPALAQSGTYGITYLAAYGSSNATCDRLHPCANLDQALLAVGPGGVVMCIDHGAFGGYSPITHSLTIDCTGTNAYIGQLNIQTSSSDVVILKNFLIDEFNSTGTGSANGVIKFTGAGTLELEDIRISKMLGSSWSGVLFAPSGTAKLTMTNCDITNIGTGGSTAGVTIRPVTGAQVTFAIEHSRINNNNFGIIAQADSTAGSAIRGVIRDSVITGNTNSGITAQSAGATNIVTIDNTTFANNGYGIIASGGGVVLLVRRSTMTTNGTGLFTAGGAAITSYGDNALNANTTTDGAFNYTIGLH